MSNEITTYNGSLAVVTRQKGDYLVTTPYSAAPTKMKRDVDFGVIPGTKSPCLFKSGAEKVAMAYGAMQHFVVESSIENYGDDPFFFYRVRCDLVKVGKDGTEYVFTSGYGSSNTKEKRNGFNDAFNSANATLKMAEKRALVSAALHISGMSDAFTQDEDNENFMKQADAFLKSGGAVDNKITAKQVKRIFALAKDAGLNAEQAKTKIAAAGFAKSSDITQDKYDEVCALFSA